MGVWPAAQPSRYSDDDAATYSTVVNPNASANTKGSWVTLIATTAFPAQGILMTLVTGSVNIDYLYDLAIGSAGNEQTIASNLLLAVYEIGVEGYYLPIGLPAGVRLSARCQANGASKVGAVKLQLIGGGYRGQSYTRSETWGAATGDSGGTSIDPGGSAGTKGSWVQLVASSAFPVRQLLVAAGGQANLSRTNCTNTVDIGIGSAGNEQVIVPNLTYWMDANADHVLPGLYGPLPVMIPAGTRVAARTKSSITDATDRLIDIVGYGFG